METWKTPNSPKRSQKRRWEDWRTNMTENVNVNCPLRRVKTYIKCKRTEYCHQRAVRVRGAVQRHADTHTRALTRSALCHAQECSSYAHPDSRGCWAGLQAYWKRTSLMGKVPEARAAPPPILLLRQQVWDPPSTSSLRLACTGLMVRVCPKLWGHFPSNLLPQINPSFLKQPLK